MASRCRLLVALTRMGYTHARRALQADFDLVPVFKVEQAIVTLKGGEIDAILCSIHFDESQMFDLLREATEIAPDTPFVCCVMLASRLCQPSLDALIAAARYAGACGCIDYNTLQRNLGFAEADRRFREELLRVLERDCGLPKAASSG